METRRDDRFGWMLATVVMVACRPATPGGAPTGADDTGAATIAATLVEHGVHPTPDGSEREAFGPMQAWDAGADWTIQNPVPLQTPDRGAGLVVADLDADGRLDVFLPNITACELFLGEADGLLVDATERLPDAGADCDAWAASAADTDGDGDLDLFVASRGRANRLLENAGDAWFTDATERSGLGRARGATVGGSWADLEGDGDLDLFVANHADRESPSPSEVTPNELFLNDGSGAFIDASDLLGTDGRDAATFVGGWWDVDLDGALDLYLVNDWGDQLLHNQVLHNASEPGDPRLDKWRVEGLDITGCTMGLGAGDLNDDGVIDFAVTDIGSIHLLVSTSGDWYDMAASLGVGPDADLGRVSSWSIELADLDNDADLDVFATFGSVERAEDPDDLHGQPDGAWLQGDDGTFVEVASDWGLDQSTVGRGLVLADFDGDGWLDIFRRDYKGGPARLDVARPGAASWLVVDVSGPAPNRFGIGTRVVVRAGGQTQRRWIQAGSTAMASSGPPEVHFGLGGAEVVDRLAVTWPDGRTSVFEDVAARQRVTVVRSDAH